MQGRFWAGVHTYPVNETKVFGPDEGAKIWSRRCANVFQPRIAKLPVLEMEKFEAGCLVGIVAPDSGDVLFGHLCLNDMPHLGTWPEEPSGRLFA